MQSVTSATPSQALIDLAERVADAARAVTLRYFRSDLAVDTKTDLSPVTLADRNAEAAMRDLLAQEVPEHGIVGEEHGTEGRDREYVWILDPIDGTKSFITGNPLFGTLVALAHKGRPVLGVIDFPALGERWIGAGGRRTLHRDARGQEREIRVRACISLEDAVLRCTSPSMFTSEQDVAAFGRVARSSRLTIYGGDCFCYAQLASGWADVVVEGDLQPYDFMALLPVVEGAGGCASDWRGQPLSLDSDGSVVFASNQKLRDEVLQKLLRD